MAQFSELRLPSAFAPKDGAIITWDLESGAAAGKLEGHGDASGASLTNAQVVSCLADAGGAESARCRHLVVAAARCSMQG
eukprot:SAG11_NODE_3054_length_2725_cov_4.495811_2_plen_80_part_00